MNKDNSVRFIKATEKMVIPETVAQVTQGAQMLMKLPVAVQKYIMTKASVNNPYMSFIVEPYAFFLAYEITDMDKASRLVPAGYELAPSSMFHGTKERPCAIIGAFNIHTSVFWGSRVEMYLIAVNKKTGMMSWIIGDYESNTINYDPGNGFNGASTAHSVVTTSFRGELIVDVAGRDGKNRFAATADLESGKMTALNQRLWLEGNLSVDYGGSLHDGKTKAFGLIFDPREMARALKLPLKNVAVEQNSFGGGILSGDPFEACCFPYTQHFITTSVPRESPMKTGSDLKKAVADMCGLLELKDSSAPGKN
ncbi:MAG: hypothetical protein HZC28_04090 [Spirochaetes bacterium]|nr:hypothetical protein [Spirochaetota bacterium]